MKKSMQLFLLATVVLVTAHSQEITYPVRYTDMETTITFYENSLEYKYHDWMTDIITTRHGKYTLSNVDGITFMDVVFETGEKEKWLVLRNELLCYLYKNEPQPFFTGASGSSRRMEVIIPFAKEAEATSFLTEKNTSYPPSNLKLSGYIARPWVEGAPGQGIGEKLVLHRSCSALLFSSGYVSYTKPYLYKQNSRPKAIRISVKDAFSFVFTLEDTPNFQRIALPQESGEKPIEIETLSVYEGDKYQDTCINTIAYDIAPIRAN